MSLRLLPGKNRHIYAFSIVPYAHPEFLIIISDFHLDLPRLGVRERVSQRFCGDYEDFVAQNGMQIARLTFNGDAKRQRLFVRWISS
jgi:hypothetical protein